MSHDPLLGETKPAPRWAWAALAALMVVGTALRLWALDKDSFWLDELIRVSEARQADARIVCDSLRNDVHPPGYILLLHAITKFGGASEWAYRFPSALAGILFIPILFLLGLRLYSHREGLAAAALAAFLHCPIDYSREAAPYMLLAAVTSGATILWLPLMETLRGEGRVRWGLALPYGVLVGLSFYLHYFGILFFGLQAALAFMLCIKRPRAMAWLACIYTIPWLIFAPWLPYFFGQLGGSQDVAAHMKAPGAGFFFKFLKTLFNGEHPVMVGVLVLYAVALFKAVTENFSAAPKPDELPARGGIGPATAGFRSAFFKSSGVLLVLWLLIPTLIVFGASQTGKPMTKDRYLLISMAPAYLLLARAFMRLPTRWLPPAIAALFCAGMLVEMTVAKLYYSAPQNQQFREAIQYALDHGGRKPGTLRLAHLGQAGIHYTNYYFERFGAPRGFDLHAGRAEDIPRVDAYLKEHAPLCVVLVFVKTQDEIDPRFVDFLTQRCTLVHQQEFLRAKIWIFENKDPRNQ